MARIVRNDRMAWFKMDAGNFLAETMGLSNQHVGIYIKLIALYWTGGNTLPSDDIIFKRRLGVKSGQDEVILNELLAEFFPKDSTGKHYHVILDEQLKAIQEYSHQQSARASKTRSRIPEPIIKDLNEDDQF